MGRISVSAPSWTGSPRGQVPGWPESGCGRRGFLPGGEGGRTAASLVFSHQVKLVALQYALGSFVSVRVNAHLGVAATTPLANALFVFLCLQRPKL